VLRAIVFDFDGVIANSEPFHFAAFRDILADEQVALTESEYYAQYSVSTMSERSKPLTPTAMRLDAGPPSRRWWRGRRCDSRRSSATDRSSSPARPTPFGGRRGDADRDRVGGEAQSRSSASSNVKG